VLYVKTQLNFLPVTSKPL